MAPATFSSGMVQINVFAILFFASYIPQAAAALGYASLLVQTPLGVLSNVILVPFFPLFSRLAAPDRWDELKLRIRQCLIFTGITMLPLGALMAVLSRPTVQIIYERYAFDAQATEITASMLYVYSLGMFVYLGRDVLVRVFYALGDGVTPFRISVINIFLNVLFAAVFCTMARGIGSGFSHRSREYHFHGGFAHCPRSSVTWHSLVELERADYRFNRHQWGGGACQFGDYCYCSAPTYKRVFWQKAILLITCGSGGMAVFLLLTIGLGLPELNELLQRLKQKFFA
jgi:putative peptidoglycan lipid II flippase